MFTKLSDSNKAVIFTVLALFMALIAALIVNLLNVTSEFLGAGLYAFTPALATLMLLLVTPEGFSKEGRNAHRAVVGDSRSVHDEGGR